MHQGTVLFIEEKELREQIKEFAKMMINDTIDDIISDGKNGMPYIASLIEKGGVDFMSVEDLIDMAEPWVDRTMDNEEYLSGVVLLYSDNSKQAVLAYSRSAGKKQ